MEQTSRDPWRAMWRIAISDYLFVGLCLAVASGLAVTLWLPQNLASDPVAYARWLSEAQARFGDTTSTLQTLGLFAVTRSLVFRALLALLAGCLLSRLIEGGDRLRQHRQITQPVGAWHPLAGVRFPGVTEYVRHRRYRVLGESPLYQADRWPWADLFPPLAQGGALLFLAGALAAHLWGWQVAGLIVQSEQQVTLPGTTLWVALDDDGCKVAHSPGLVIFVETCGPGVRASALSRAGKPLELQGTPEAGPVAQLTVSLTEDQYFAIPEAQLIVRLAPQAGHPIAAHSPVLVQVYHSPSGRLASEQAVEGTVELEVGDVTLELASTPYARLTAAFNPGLWPTGMGLVLLGVGVLGSVAWPARRFWLREEGGLVAGTGDLLPAWVESREA